MERNSNSLFYGLLRIYRSEDVENLIDLSGAINCSPLIELLEKDLFGEEGTAEEAVDINANDAVQEAELSVEEEQELSKGNVVSLETASSVSSSVSFERASGDGVTSSRTHKVEGHENEESDEDESSGHLELAKAPEAPPKESQLKSTESTEFIISNLERRSEAKGGLHRKKAMKLYGAEKSKAISSGDEDLSKSLDQGILINKKHY